MDLKPIFRHCIPEGKTEISGLDSILNSFCFERSDSYIGEIAKSDGWITSGLIFKAHCFVINLHKEDFIFQLKRGQHWEQQQLRPDEIWVYPEGQPIKVRFNQSSFVTRLFIEDSALVRLTGSSSSIRDSMGVNDEVLASMMRALTCLLKDKYSLSRDSLLRSMGKCFIDAFADRYGSKHGRTTVAGDLPPYQMEKLDQWIRANVGTPFKVERMAMEAGLSTNYFARAFKRTTGLTPWDYVLNMRLQAAIGHIEAGESIGRASVQAGFADQSHFTRMFKRRFGVPPLSYFKSQLANRARGQAVPFLDHLSAIPGSHLQ